MRIVLKNFDFFYEGICRTSSILTYENSNICEIKNVIFNCGKILRHFKMFQTVSGLIRYDFREIGERITSIYFTLTH